MNDALDDATPEAPSERDVDDDGVSGTVAAGFETVRREFVRNLRDRGELGAAVCVEVDGERVVDLRGGHRDRARRSRWRPDTLVLVFSVTKAMSAFAIAHAASRGRLDYDEPVATYWPEFARRGKADVTLRVLHDHAAGLAAIDERLTPELLADLDALAEVLADQRPLWEPGRRHGYHGQTLGFFQNELIRRVDGRTISRYFADEIATPLGADAHIQLPPDTPDERIAELRSFGPTDIAREIRNLPAGLLGRFLVPWSATSRSLTNPFVPWPTSLDAPRWRRVEWPSAGGYASARGLARLYGDAATGGDAMGLTDEVFAELTRTATPGEDEVLRTTTAYAGGFMKPSPALRFGTSPRAFGSFGAGGSLAYADPDTSSSYAYVMNRLAFTQWGMARERALRDSVDRCLRKVA